MAPMHGLSARLLGVGLAVLPGMLLGEGAAAQEIVHGPMRGPTSRRRIAVQWKSPSPAKDAKTTTFDEALAEIRGRDLRPILILRDAPGSESKAKALEPFEAANERTLLFTHFFRCIKADRRVGERSHPWYPLFAAYPKAVILLCSGSGKTVVPLASTQPQKKFQAAMLSVLRLDYRRDAAAAVKRWLQLLRDLDKADADIKDLEQRLFVAREKKRSAARIKRDASRLAAARKRRARVFKLETANANLVLRKAPKQRTAESFDDEAAAEVSAHGGNTIDDRIKKQKKGEGKE